MFPLFEIDLTTITEGFGICGVQKKSSIEILERPFPMTQSKMNMTLSHSEAQDDQG